jgi:hypothetical protein
MKKTLTLLGAIIVVIIVLTGCSDLTTPSDKIVNITIITGVTAPAYGEIPVTTITETDQYTGTVSWSGSPSTFAAETVYTATITLTAKTGYTLTGVSADFFTVAGASSVTNATDSGVVTAVFPATGSATIEMKTPVMHDLYDGEDWHWNAVYSDDITITIDITDEEDNNIEFQSTEPKIIYLDYSPDNGTTWVEVESDTLEDFEDDDRTLAYIFKVEEWESMDVAAGDWPIRFRFDGDSRYDGVTQPAVLSVLKETPVMYDLDDGDWHWTAEYSDELFMIISITDDDVENLFHQVDELKTIYLDYSPDNGTTWVEVESDTLLDSNIADEYNDDNTLTYFFKVEEWESMDVAAGDWPIRFRFDGDSRYDGVTQPAVLSVLKETPVMYDLDDGDWHWTAEYSDELFMIISITDDDVENLFHQIDEPNDTETHLDSANRKADGKMRFPDSRWSKQQNVFFLTQIFAGSQVFDFIPFNSGLKHVVKIVKMHSFRQSGYL